MFRCHICSSHLTDTSSRVQGNGRTKEISKLYVSVSFSSCFYNVEGDFPLNKINFVGGDKLLPVFKHGFLRSEENVFPVICIHTKCVWENMFIYNFDFLMYGWYFHTCRQMVLPCYNIHNCFVTCQLHQPCNII